MTIDPNVTASTKNGLFGLSPNPNSAKIWILPVPWDVTTSYGGGASRGPGAVLDASPQLDFFDLEIGNAYTAGFYMPPISEQWMTLNDQLKPLALKLRGALEEGRPFVHEEALTQARINQSCASLYDWVLEESRRALTAKKIPAVLGGDHSTPLGLIQAVSESCQGDFGILHLDAHADLRKSYQGFTFSHASIMRNVMDAKWAPKKLVQVAIRDFCQEEFEFIQQNPSIQTFFDQELKRQLFSGRAWGQICAEIIEKLPKAVYISLDIDGLSPEFCPGTGTPVPGGLSFDQAIYLLGEVARSGRRIVGFDLNEIAPSSGEWDGNVGAPVLYKLCGYSILSNSGVKS